ncbi:MAG: VCBS repeat-containing protein, partial [Chloroflexota bacterium]
MNTIRQHWSVILFVILCLATGCTPLTLSSTPTTLTIDHYAYMPLDVDDCAGHFIPHPLDHITAIDGDVVRTFDSNGAGLAVNDLDRDGDLDLVMANLAGANAIFWNEGALKFRKQPFPHGQSRAVSIVDIDGDGWQDIVFAHRETRPWVWMNQGEFNPAEGEHPRSTGHIDGFTRLDWFSASQRAYTFAWADLDGDIDLDLVLATYQTE